MPTPRPLGVRRANNCEEQFVKHVTSLPALVALILVAPRVSLRSHSARSAQPHCPRQRTRGYPSRGLALSARATSQAGDR